MCLPAGSRVGPGKVRDSSLYSVGGGAWPFSVHGVISQLATFVSSTLFLITSCRAHACLMQCNSRQQQGADALGCSFAAFDTSALTEVMT